jgi:hypothetical protein
MEKPSYSSTRRYLWLSGVAAWAVILLLTGGAIMGSEQAVAFGSIALPTMFAIITGNLAVHRGFGSADFRAQGKVQPPTSGDAA